MASSALKIVNGVPRMTTVGVEVRDEGGVILSEASALDFTGSSITAVDAGSGVAQIGVGTNPSDIYDETVTVPSGGYAQNSNVTLPSSGSYDSVELQVFLNGFFLQPGVDYDYVGTGSRTQIEILRTDVSEGDNLRFRIDSSTGVVYDQTVIIDSNGINAGENVSLPDSKTYEGSELKVYLDGFFLQPLVDYNYVGAAPRTQIQMVVELFEGERLRFRIDY